MIRRPPRSTLSSSSAASDVYKRQVHGIEKYFGKMTYDFHINKKILEEVGQVPSKRIKNKIAGYATHIMKRIQRGNVRGISLKLQEMERERRMEQIPEQSNINIEGGVFMTEDTKQMLRNVHMDHLFQYEKKDQRQQNRRR
eukprot:TRINITY_DN565_c0_g1_i7.p1 TRINITY_DN565_c0_g1~~TRINITY_DN565_c0_g1_i7.p1  ORF type:complete len:141 (-),score=36.63 TRINITY_DN565_c0_g1_i7:29-451(-)